MGVLCLALFTLNAQAVEDLATPGLAAGARVVGEAITDISVGVIKTGDAYLYFSDSALSDGGVFGYYKQNEPARSWLAVSLPVTPLTHDWDSLISTGIYYERAGVVTSPTKTEMLVNAQYPFAWTVSDQAQFGRGVLYNQVCFVPALTPNLMLTNGHGSGNPRGVQVQAAQRPGLAEELNLLQKISVVSIDLFSRRDSVSVSSLEAAQTSPIGLRGVNAARVNIAPYDAGHLDLPAVGEVVLTAQGEIISVPGSCLIAVTPAAGMLCPFNAQGIQGGVKYMAKEGFLFKSKPLDAGSATLTTNSLTHLFYPAGWLSNKLGTQNSVDLMDYPSLSLGGLQHPSPGTGFAPFSRLTIRFQL